MHAHNGHLYQAPSPSSTRIEEPCELLATAADVLPHVVATPLREGPRLPPDELRREIARHQAIIMDLLGLDLSDDSLAGTPDRIARMYVDEIFAGLDEANFPKLTAVRNQMQYDEMLLETGITFDSTCEHHFLPVLGQAHIAYVCKGWVLGLSKFNRLVDFFAKRPQIQERATVQIQQALAHVLRTPDVAVVVDGIHTCVRTRGIRDRGTVTRTMKLGGAFQSDPARRAEFLHALPTPDRLRL